jgi:hypothetical protein
MKKRIPVWRQHEIRTSRWSGFWSHLRVGGKAFRNWTTRHDKAITLVGAFLIFCTFLARDNKKEEYKDLVSEIHNARTTFDIRYEHTYPTSLLLDINEDVQLLKATRSATNSGHSPIASNLQLNSQIQHELQDAGATYFMAMMQFDQLAKLDEHLKDETEIKSQLDSHHDACIDGLEEKEELNKDFRNSIANQGDRKPPSEGKFTLTEVNEKALGLQQRAGKEMEFYASIYPHVVEQIEKEEKSGNERLKFYSWASFWVFALGWALTLSAKLTGIKFGAGGE